MTDAYKTIKLAKKFGYLTVQSRRSGETETNPIIDLAVAWNCEFIKVGVAGIAAIQLNNLLRLEEELEPRVKMVNIRIKPQ